MKEAGHYATPAMYIDCIGDKVNNLIGNEYIYTIVSDIFSCFFQVDRYSSSSG